MSVSLFRCHADVAGRVATSRLRCVVYGAGVNLLHKAVRQGLVQSVPKRHRDRGATGTDVSKSLYQNGWSASVAVSVVSVSVCFGARSRTHSTKSLTFNASRSS